MSNVRITSPDEKSNRLEQLINAQPTNGFNKRDKGLKLKTFLFAFTIYLSSLGRITLEEIANKCCAIQEEGLTLTKQAMSARLEAGSRELKALMSAAINASIESKPENQITPMILSQFESVNITDATILALPNSLADKHKGFGGDGSDAALKIQATYDVKSKDFRLIDLIDDATESDHKYVSRLIEDAKANELFIFDLGYYGVDGFLRISAKGAYFISKIKTNVNIYGTDGKKMDLYALLCSNTKIDEMIMIKGASGETMNVRLTGVRLPEKVYSNRIRKAKKSGKTLSVQDKERLKWILIITNVESDILSFDAICELYRIRWQIELIFKSWKSHFKLDEMNNVGKNYLDCLIFGKLTMITIMTSLYSSLYHLVLFSLGRRLSFLRFMKNIRAELDIIALIISYYSVLNNRKQKTPIKRVDKRHFENHCATVNRLTKSLERWAHP